MLLRVRPFREVTIPEVMRHTGLKRPAFYAHFRDRSDLILHVVAHIGAELFDFASRWLEGSDAEADMLAAFEGIARVYTIQGPILRALADAAPTDAAVEQAYGALVQSFIDASAGRIESEQAAGRIPRDLDAPRTAQALVLLSERYLSAALGRHPQDDAPQVAAVLSRIWLATLYGGAARA